MEKKVRKISPKAFTHVFSEAEKCNKRFCFILGAGASRQAGILTGVEMAEKWASQLTEKYEEKELRTLMKNLDIESIEANSKNYFGIYDLRFYPDYQEGYAYFERELEKGVPSLGHHVLAKILAGKKHNLAITTNFDSLIEDALFIYTNKHPLLVGHESLAQFINLNIDRPVVAKIHRSLYYQPFNRQQEINALAEEWKNTLKNAFMVYTPIVIGYAGGDQSLMKFLCDSNVKMNGLYWCYWNKEEPSEEIIDLVMKKNGCLVPIESFDQIMFMFSRKLGVENPEEEMKEVTRKRIERYNLQYDEFEKRIREESAKENSSKDIIEETLSQIDSLNNQLLKDAEKEETSEAYLKKGRIYRRMEKYEEAIEAYTKAIELDPNVSEAYNNRGATYYVMGEYEKAIEDYSQAIKNDPDFSQAYNNRGVVYYERGEYEKAIKDYIKAIELNPNYSRAYSNKGAAHNKLREYEKAIEDCTKAIELNPNLSKAYNNRGAAYNEMGEYEKAIENCEKAIKIDSKLCNAYKHMGVAYYRKNDFLKALSYLDKAIELDPKYKEAYEMRAKVYRALNKGKEAEEDEKRAEKTVKNSWVTEVQ